MTEAPIISIIIPSLNEADKVVKCLENINNQTYPHDKLDVIFADGFSSDETRKLINEWQNKHDIPVRIIDNPKIVAEFGTAIAIKEAKGAFFCIQGCDHELMPENALEIFVESFTVFPDIAGVKQETLKVPDSTIFNNYAAITGGIQDPLAAQLVQPPKLLESKTLNNIKFSKYEFSAAYPFILFFSKAAISPFIERDTFEEGQVMLELALKGNNKIAIIEGYGYRHHHATSFKAFLRKRIKIASKYTTRRKERETWVQHTGNRLYFFVIWNLTLIGPALYSVYKFIKNKEPLWLWHAPLCFSATLMYIVCWGWIRVTGKNAW